MKKQLGIWIDRSKAILVSLENGIESVSEMSSEMETRERIKGEGKAFARFGDQYSDPEKKKQARLDHERKTFLNDIYDYAKDYIEILICGPASMKNHLNSKFESEKAFRGHVVDVLASDSQTTNQIRAFVRSYFE